MGEQCQEAHDAVDTSVVGIVDVRWGTWHYRVSALHINGGGTATREDVQREYDSDTHVIALEVSIAPAA